MQTGIVEWVPPKSSSKPGGASSLFSKQGSCESLHRNTTKVTVVLKTLHPKGSNFIDCRHVGPSLNLHMLLRFRSHQIILTTDIGKAFLNIEMDPEHRDFGGYLRGTLGFSVLRFWLFIRSVFVPKDSGFSVLVFIAVCGFFVF